MQLHLPVHVNLLKHCKQALLSDQWPSGEIGRDTTYTADNNGREEGWSYDEFLVLITCTY